MKKTILPLHSLFLSLLICTLLLACSPATGTSASPLSFATHTITTTPSTPPQTPQHHPGSTSSSSQSQGAQTPNAIESQIAQTVFAAINQDRAQAGLPPLQWSAALARSARTHDFAMMAANLLSHQLPGEPVFTTRESQQGVRWLWAAENVGVTSLLTSNGALGLHHAMMAEQPPDNGHRLNILTTQGTLLGVDILIDTQHHKLWLAEDFAKV